MSRVSPRVILEHTSAPADNVALPGDFTRSLVNDPPRTLWTRELKVGRLRTVLRPCSESNPSARRIYQFAGVSNTSTLYKRGIRICTGTGIGAALSTCIQSPYWYACSHILLRGQRS